MRKTILPFEVERAMRAAFEVDEAKPERIVDLQTARVVYPSSWGGVGRW
jgi:hypothetical protein